MNPFPHEKLDVYKKSLQFGQLSESITASWESRHCVKDHLARASESMIVSLAEGSSVSSAGRITCLDYALGSTLECAACMAVAIGCFPASDAEQGKLLLRRVRPMIVGLMSYWVPQERTVIENVLRRQQDKGGDKGGGEGGG